MSDKPDEEVIASHAYRDGKIFFTVLITGVRWGYRINREDTKHLLGMAPSEKEAIEWADMYLLGITTGYDLGIEHGKGTERHTHERTDAHYGPHDGYQCSCSGSTPSEGERRD